MWNPVPIEGRAELPVNLGRWPQPEPVDLDGDGTSDGAYYTKEQLILLNLYKIASEGNFEIATANAEAFEGARDAYTALGHAGRTEAEVREFYRKLAEYERGERAATVWTLRALIVALGIAGL